MYLCRKMAILAMQLIPLAYPSFAFPMTFTEPGTGHWLMPPSVMRNVRLVAIAKNRVANVRGIRMSLISYSAMKIKQWQRRRGRRQVQQRPKAVLRDRVRTYLHICKIYPTAFGLPLTEHTVVSMFEQLLVALPPDPQLPLQACGLEALVMLPSNHLQY